MAMIRGVHPDVVDRTVEALAQGGIRFVKVTTNTVGVYTRLNVGERLTTTIF